MTAQRSALLRTLWRVLRAPLLALAVVVLWIEEWGWQPLSARLARLSRWPVVAKLEALIRRAPPGAALALFLVPALLLLPIKLAALWLIHEDRVMLGVSLIVAAKLLGTALVGRLFVLCEPQLMQFAWFVRLLAWWHATKANLSDVVRRSPLWQAVRRGRRWLRTHLRRDRLG